MILVGRRASAISLALLPGSSTHGSAASQALREIMLMAPGGKELWLLNEISSFNLPVKRHAFPKEASTLLRDALDVTLSPALSTHKDSPPMVQCRSLLRAFSKARDEASTGRVPRSCRHG